MVTTAAHTTVDYRTMTPGTYTLTASNVVSVIIIPEWPDQTPEPEPTPSHSSLRSSSTGPRVITVVETTVVTVGDDPLGTITLDESTTERPVSSTRAAEATPSQGEGSCSGLCDCSKVKDKTSEEYYQCLTNPECEKCWKTSSSSSTQRASSTSSSASPASSTAPAATSAPATNTKTGTSTSGAAVSTPPPCPDYCDCSKIEDKESEGYFQCVRNPSCERCRKSRA
ncbi:hypothetical protein CDD83_1759 [Cordyceps sp. RAO-2017]|nr:hypothetical protein CDD83_1759 [Cordyceps sp. RAO-2017]